MSTPFVSICVPSMSTWWADTALSLIGLVQHETKRGTPVHIANLQCCVISHARNLLTLQSLSLEPKCTHILWVDSDIVVPANALERLLAHDKDVVGAFYTRRSPPHTTAGFLIGNPDISKGGLYPAYLMPHGFVLVKREVYEKLPRPWYFESQDKATISERDPFGHVGEDTNFTQQCLRHGFEVLCDTDLTFETGHIGETVFTCERPEPRSSA